MADSVEPTNEDIAETPENEVEAHAESPLDLQEMGVSKPDQGEGVLGGLQAPGSTVSLAACA
ncbi:hypothetical protein ACIOC1_12225 [Streptomyces sp. NPDC088197]|uniref:hypothetical protein n=1 Tax=unclassified Streptomyces TaxID=2593676 RepID=UPI0016620FB8|nr:hypothetical protein [Streptomyces sp. CBMA29]MBD0738413.1 hypothetical protein [Streptomyces sp. CBMA29]